MSAVNRFVQTNSLEPDFSHSHLSYSHTILAHTGRIPAMKCLHVQCLTASLKADAAGHSLSVSESDFGPSSEYNMQQHLCKCIWTGKKATITPETF